MELVVAIALSGLVFLAGRMMLDQLADRASQLGRAAVINDRLSNRERLLSRMLSQLEVGTDSARTFSGEVERARFWTWCDQPGGWVSRCHVELTIDRLAGGPVMVLRRAKGDSLVIQTGFSAGSFRFASNVSDQATWFARWGDGPTAPMALITIIDRDTTIFRIGDRG